MTGQQHGVNEIEFEINMNEFEESIWRQLKSGNQPSVTCCDGNECFRGGSRHGDSKYGFTGDSTSRLSRGVDFLLGAGNSVSSSLFDSSTTILNPSWLNEGVKDDLRSRLKCSAKSKKQQQID